jgi:hypothetical protein
LLNVQTHGETQVVAPVHPSPPHFAHLSAGGTPLETVVVDVLAVVVDDVVVRLRVVVEEVLTEVVVDEVRTLVVVGAAEVVVVREIVVVARVVDGELPPASAMAAFNGSYQQLASLTFPLSLG